MRPSWDRKLAILSYLLLSCSSSTYNASILLVTYFSADCKMVEKVAYYFLSGNLKFELTREELNDLTWNNQEKFLKLTVHSKLFKSYPLRQEYCRLFFHKLIQNLEPHQEIHDGIFEFVCALVTKNFKEDQFCHRHYIFNHDLNNIITIKETNNMVINGTTGMKTWEAAQILSDWIICNKQLFHNKHVLELGAGVGFTGITIAKLCFPKSITITDCHDDVLKLLSENIEINLPGLHKEESLNTTCFKNTEKQIYIRKLDWNCIEHIDDSLKPDAIIGADIVYDPSVLMPLCNVIRTFLKRNFHTEVYIACIIRNDVTFQKFLEHLGEMNLRVEEFTPTKCVSLDWNQDIPRSLLKIKTKI